MTTRNFPKKSGGCGNASLQIRALLMMGKKQSKKKRDMQIIPPPPLPFFLPLGVPDPLPEESTGRFVTKKRDKPVNTPSKLFLHHFL